jgi:hypothetical protein
MSSGGFTTLYFILVLFIIEEESIDKRRSPFCDALFGGPRARSRFWSEGIVDDGQN